MKIGDIYIVSNDTIVKIVNIHDYLFIVTILVCSKKYHKVGENWGTTKEVINGWTKL